MKGYLYSIYDTALKQVIMYTCHENDKDAREKFKNSTKELDAKSLALCRMASIDTETNELKICKQEVIIRGKNNIKRAKVLQQDQPAAEEGKSDGR